METASIPTEQMKSMSALVPAEDEVLLHASQLRADMVVVASSYQWRRDPYFVGFYCPEEPVGSARPSQWCQIMEYKLTSDKRLNVNSVEVITFVGKHADGALVNYEFALLGGTTEFIVKRDSIA